MKSLANQGGSAAADEGVWGKAPFKSNAFSSYHPVISLLYFSLVIGLTMFFTHPICLAISLLCAVVYSLHLGGRKALRFGLLYLLPMLIITALINPAFTHQGVTILTYLPNGNPLTLESIVYGVFTGVLLVCVISWFSCFNAVMTSDKFVYLFGRIIPALSLILSMSLRFVPRFAAQIKVISKAQRGIGRDVRTGGIIKRARHGIRILSILITWALENAIDTADSMKSRGYGLRGRTAFSIFRFTRRDKYALVFLLLFGGYVLAGAYSGELRFLYYPVIGRPWCSDSRSPQEPFTPYLISLFAAWFVLAVMPIFINIKESVKWKRLQYET
jgi:energy-coupling factor transport system permease protein